MSKNFFQNPVWSSEDSSDSGYSCDYSHLIDKLKNEKAEKGGK